MASQELAGSSSSPNVNLLIQSIYVPEEDSGAEGEILLSDGSSFFLPLSFFKTQCLQVGDMVDASLREKIIKNCRRTRCRHKAVDYLARREHSRGELSVKLRKKEFPSSLVDEILDELEETGWLSDERFVREWLRTKLRRPKEGPLLLLAKLQQKGVSEDLARNCVDEMYTPALRIQALGAAYKKAKPRFKANKGRIYGYLQRRGFVLLEINRFFCEISEDSY